MIETRERLLRIFASAGRPDKCRELAAEMMKMAKENPADFGSLECVPVAITRPRCRQ
jgi:hypothetical protein